MTNKKLVYLVSAGEYSDYGIRCVFSTKAQALEYIKLCHEYGDDYVNDEPEEYELDPEIKDPSRFYKFKYFYYVQIDKDGNVKRCNKDSIDIFDPQNTKERLYFTRDFLDQKPFLCGSVNANSGEHAIKIMGEKRTKLLYENKWLDTMPPNTFSVNI